MHVFHLISKYINIRRYAITFLYTLHAVVQKRNRPRRLFLFLKTPFTEYRVTRDRIGNELSPSENISSSIIFSLPHKAAVSKKLYIRVDSFPDAITRTPMIERVESIHIYNMSATHDVHVRELTSLCPRTSRMPLRRLAHSAEPSCAETFIREEGGKKIKLKETSYVSRSRIRDRIEPFSRVAFISNCRTWRNALSLLAFSSPLHILPHRYSRQSFLSSVLIARLRARISHAHISFSSIVLRSRSFSHLYFSPPILYCTINPRMCSNNIIICAELFFIFVLDFWLE